MKSKFEDYQPVSRTKETADVILRSIHAKANHLGKPLKIMHVCGTHEATVSRSGMRALLPQSIRVISGPGCPVCIAPGDHIATAVKLAEEGAMVITFGDMFKVPDGNLQTLSKIKAKGKDVRVVYSVSDAINLAEKYPDRKIVWLGVGFETTAPMTSFVLEKGAPENFHVLSDFRLVPPALELLVNAPDFDLDGFILPGHVCTITGVGDFQIFPQKYNLPSVVAGFDAIDFLISIDRLLDQLITGESLVDNAYPRVVTELGNTRAQESIDRVFRVTDAGWRGIGTIKQSGLKLATEYEDHDAYHLTDPVDHVSDLPKGCKCGSVILGKVEPEECPHFLRRCHPGNAIGPCMVSDEGTCRIRATYQQIVS